MKSLAFITGADRGLGLALCSGLLEQGWEVFAGQYMPEWPELSELSDQYPGLLHPVPLDVSSLESVQAAADAVAATTDHIDLLINNAGVLSADFENSIRKRQDYAEMHRQYNINALGPLRVVEAFLPLTDRGRLKRLCFVSSEAGSITRAGRTGWFGYCMSKAALNMAAKILFSDLKDDGYTFRVYHPGWMKTYIEGEKNVQAHLEPETSANKAIPIFLNQNKNEEHLSMVDYEGNEWPW